MKYNDNHKRDFEGAKGKCETCGLDVELDYKDKPIKRMSTSNKPLYYVNCPHCSKEIVCKKDEN